MPFEPGRMKTGGRKQGAKKALLKKPTKEWFADRNIHPLDFLKRALDRQEAAIEDIIDPAEKARALNEVTKRVTEILPYVLPKIKEQDPGLGQGLDLEALKNVSSDNLKGLLQQSTLDFNKQTTIADDDLDQQSIDQDD